MCGCRGSSGVGPAGAAGVADHSDPALADGHGGGGYGHGRAAECCGFGRGRPRRQPVLAGDVVHHRPHHVDYAVGFAASWPRARRTCRGGGAAGPLDGACRRQRAHRAAAQRGADSARHRS